jgi:hypothetical protein
MWTIIGLFKTFSIEDQGYLRTNYKPVVGPEIKTCLDWHGKVLDAIIYKIRAR